MKIFSKIQDWIYCYQYHIIGKTIFFVILGVFIYAMYTSAVDDYNKWKHRYDVPYENIEERKK